MRDKDLRKKSIKHKIKEILINKELERRASEIAHNFADKEQAERREENPNLMPREKYDAYQEDYKLAYDCALSRLRHERKIAPIIDIIHRILTSRCNNKELAESLIDAGGLWNFNFDILNYLQAALIKAPHVGCQGEDIKKQWLAFIKQHIRTPAEIEAQIRETQTRIAAAQTKIATLVEENAELKALIAQQRPSEKEESSELSSDSPARPPNTSPKWAACDPKRASLDETEGSSSPSGQQHRKPRSKRLRPGSEAETNGHTGRQAHSTSDSVQSQPAVGTTPPNKRPKC